jgi:hypothetical protein
VNRIRAALLLIALDAVAGQAQVQGPVGAVYTPAPRPPYLQRGVEVEKRYGAHREKLQEFFGALSERVRSEAPDLLTKITPPSDVPYGYQILPTLLPMPVWRPRPSRVTLSPFSWSRTDSLIDRDRAKLALLEGRLPAIEKMNGEDRRLEYVAIADEYKKLIAGQKFIASLIAYNRQWQAQIARAPQFYKEMRDLQDVALARQRILDSLLTGKAGARENLRRRADSLSARLDTALKKLPTPAFVRVSHPTAHKWVVSVPVFTDIADSVFVERFRSAVQDAWHVRDGDDEFMVTLDLHRVPIAALYPKGDAPDVGAHINIADHVARFPPGGVIVTTGGNGIYSTGRSIIVGPHAIAPSALSHEFGHMLGFKDGYFRSYQDGGADGYRVLEVILDSENVIAAPENGRVRRAHFEQVLRDTAQ